MYKSIDELVERIDERNRDGKISTLIGVSIDKCFINSVANINGTDLTKYKIIRRDDFAVSLMQVSRDSKIPIARLKDYDQAIMSPAYPIFRVRDTSVILPEYLEMWFMRPEFDREAAFIAVGGVRGSMPWEEFAKMRLPVPSLEKQHQVVCAYQIIADRIEIKRRINDNLVVRLMRIIEVKEDKKQYLDLLLLADEQENMIDRYLDKGKMYVLDDNGIKCECIVTDEGNDVLEIKNIATVPDYQGKGYAKSLIDFIVEKYREQYAILQVGTGDSPLTIPFYEKCGFVRSHIIPNFFTDNYDHPIYEDGVQLVDMVYLQRQL